MKQQKSLSARMLKIIRGRREKVGFSQEYMAACLGMGQNCYSKLELGRNKLNVDRLFTICHLLGLSPEELLGKRNDHKSDIGRFFYLNNQPMWLFEPVTARFLEVNDAAIRNYGYSREDFATMTLFDIRPKEHINWLRGQIHCLQPDQPYFNASYHLHRNGKVREEQINCYPVNHKNGPAYLVMPQAVSLV